MSAVGLPFIGGWNKSQAVNRNVYKNDAKKRAAARRRQDILEQIEFAGRYGAPGELEHLQDALFEIDEKWLH